MTTMYTDRVIVAFNGTTVFNADDILSVTIESSGNVSAVPGMSKTHETPGFVRGNNTHRLTLGIAVRNDRTASNFSFSSYDYESNNAQITIAASSKSFGPEPVYEGKTIILEGVVYDSESVSGTTGQAMQKNVVFMATRKKEI